MKYLLLILTVITYSFTIASDKADKKIRQGNYRPLYHFSSEKNWIGQPGGLVYYGGEYHLFYQYNPNSNEKGFMHWGHAVSKDLIRWEPLPIAISPDEESKDTIHATVFSGSAIVDEKNTAGLQQGDEKTLLIFYTSYGCGQRLAYSNDKGRTWKKYDKNPLIPFENDDASGPKVFFHQPTGKWVMALYRKHEGDESKRGISIYTSNNLINWTLKSHFIGLNECPDLFQIPLDGDKEKNKWVLMSGDGNYIIGNFDGEKFIRETSVKAIDHGMNFYGAQTWSNQPDGKLIQIAWMKGGEFPGMPFNGQMTFPCELTLRTTKNGPVLCKNPIEAIATLHDKDFIKKDKNIIPGIKGNLIGGISGEAFHFKAKFNPKDSDGFGMLIRNGKKETGTEIRYESAKKILDCLLGKALVEPKNGIIELEILVDRSSIEIFANNGEIVLSSCFTPNDDDKDYTLWTQGGELLVQEIAVYELKPGWKEK
jgi:fructan beta-fructosidase